VSLKHKSRAAGINDYLTSLQHWYRLPFTYWKN